MKKIVMIYDQIQSGEGTKDDKFLELGAKTGNVGPHLMMKKYLDEKDIKVIAYIYCGDQYYFDNREIVKRKIIGMINRLKPDFVVCGPSFNYPNFSAMACELALEIKKHINSNVLVAMSKDNTELADEYSKDLVIVKVPNKGGIGLDESLKNLVEVISSLLEDKKLSTSLEEFLI